MVGLAAPFNVHAVLAFLGKARKQWYLLTIIYIAGLFLMVWFILYPDLFLLPSVPKMYFPNYYNHGILNWAGQVFFFGVCFVYMMISLGIASHQEIDSRRKQQIKYLMVGLALGYAVGNMANFLVYDIPIDPFWGTLFMTLFFIPFIYGIVKYELLDIRIIAKQAFSYGIGIGAVGGLIILFNYSNRLVETVYPNFPFWITPLISAIFVVLVAGLIWRKLRESDILKYEFVTTVTHKFRTPLTHIKWASENLSKSTLSADDQTQVKYIQSADEKLVELTRLLMNISETESSGYEYKMVRDDLSALVTEVEKGMREQYSIKNMTVIVKIEPSIYALFDQSRIRFIVQTFIENAIRYTPEGGTILISLTSKGNNVIFSVKDTGVGIAKDELSLIFSKFYRSKEARQADTEGMGIGLYVSKEIISRHNGKIWAESEGAGKGSVFSFSLEKAGV